MTFKAIPMNKDKQTVSHCLFKAENVSEARKWIDANLLNYYRYWMIQEVSQ